jgi:hypothetical protein
VGEDKKKNYYDRETANELTNGASTKAKIGRKFADSCFVNNWPTTTWPAAKKSNHDLDKEDVAAVVRRGTSGGGSQLVSNA